MQTLLYLFPTIILTIWLFSNYLKLNSFNDPEIVSLGEKLKITLQEKRAILFTRIAQFKYQQKISFVLVCISCILTIVYIFALLTKITLIQQFNIETFEKIIGILGGCFLSGGSVLLHRYTTAEYNKAVEQLSNEK